MPQLLSDLMAHEWRNSGVRAHVVADASPTMRTRTPRPSRAPGRRHRRDAVRRLRDNELFVRIVDLDPELILPYPSARRGRSQDVILELTVAALREAQAAGEVRSGNPGLMARAMLLAAHGFVLSAHTMVDDEVSLDDLDSELRRALTRGSCREARPEPSHSHHARPDRRPDRRRRRRHRPRHHRGRGRARRGHAWALGARRRCTRPRLRYVAVVLEAGPRRAALPGQVPVRRRPRERRRARHPDGAHRARTSPTRSRC